MRALAVSLLLAASAHAGEVVKLTPESWKLVPAGKEVDAIYGDYLIRNDKVVAVIGDTVPGRNANMSCKNVQGAVIDFALLETNNDQLSVFYPHGDKAVVDKLPPVPQATRAEIVKGSGSEVVLRVTRAPTLADPVEAVTEYTLRDGETFLRVATRYRNTGAKVARIRVSDKMRCDQTFAQSPAGQADLVTFYDKWFLAAYGVVRTQGKILTDGKFGGMFGANSGTWLDYPELTREPPKMIGLSPGAQVELTRFLIAGRHAAEVQATAHSILGLKHKRLAVTVQERGDKPVAGADVVIRRGMEEVSAGHTDRAGTAVFSVPEGRYGIDVLQIGRPRTASAAEVAGDTAVTVAIGPRSQADFDVTDGAGAGVACKVQFVGVEETPTPNLGPRQRANGCLNLYFSPGGRFTVPLPAGKYYVILSRGPECDAAYRYLILREGETARVSARLPRVVNTAGWISTDFHNHSTPSGDNTTEVDSRIVCLAAEGVEFAAATEHNRLMSYRDRIKALGLEKVMATSDGIELTASPLPISHHNAFPLIARPNTQDGGGPITGPDPLAQIRRLFDHDSGSEKLMQQNHPDIGWLFYDADGDGTPDMGFGTLKFTDVIEIWRPTILDMKATEQIGMSVRNNRVFNWLQLLNQGIRLPGVANTDAHYCNHESGRLRNYLRSATDDPAQVREMDVVRAARKGRMVMSNGPFLEVALDDAGPGDDLKVSGGRATLRIRVECPNWIDVDRVQVLLNGRLEPKLNFTRATHPAKFSDAVVKFKEEIEIPFVADTHVIVVAAGERSTLGPVMGQVPEVPIAISNPIFVDVDGAGFAPGKDTLGAPLPVKKSPTN